MPVSMKICGVTDPHAVAAAIDAGAEYIGFVFYPPSPRHLSVEEAALLARGIPSSIRRVGVFVNPSDAELTRAVTGVPLDVIQLHGDETRDRIIEIRNRFGIEVWKAIKIKNYSDINGVHRYADVADRVLFDARTPPGARPPYGIAQKFDWSLLKGVPLPEGWILSGGLDSSNVGDAIATTGATVVDVSSGIEERAGKKSPAFIRAFADAVKAAMARPQ